MIKRRYWTEQEVAILRARYPFEAASRIAHDLGFSELRVRTKTVALKLKKDASHWKPIGHERVATNGYLERRIAQTNDTLKDYCPVHHLVWRAAGRVIAPGHALVFCDGDKTNMALSNLASIPRAALMARNSVHNYGPEIAQLYQLQGAITRQINKRSLFKNE